MSRAACYFYFIFIYIYIHICSWIILDFLIPFFLGNYWSVHVSRSESLPLSIPSLSISLSLSLFSLLRAFRWFCFVFHLFHNCATLGIWTPKPWWKIRVILFSGFSDIFPCKRMPWVVCFMSVRTIASSVYHSRRQLINEYVSYIHIDR